jgi:hypothetical protein
MSFELEFIQKPSYLHAIVTGANTEENIFAYVEEIAKECSKRKCSRLLVEERLQGPQLKLFHVYKIVEKISHDLSGLYNAVAYVDIYQEVNLMDFGETVAVNRGFPIKVFLSVQDAEKWLLEN